jgi:nitrate reductase / nitrite oxidoreductase, alpha subunit
VPRGSTGTPSTRSNCSAISTAAYWTDRLPGGPKIDTDIDACETILMLAPETNGEVAVKAWEALSKATGRDHSHLAEGKEEEKIRFRDVVAQPRKIISSPIWSGLESEHVCYNAGYTNVHELIPWRTLTGRQQLYQDHHWMRAFGEGFVTWRPPIDTQTVMQVLGKLPNGNKEIMLNFLTPHQKWGIHSTYAENLIMLSLNRGGPMVWISETDDARPPASSTMTGSRCSTSTAR